LLLDRGADINQPDRFGATPLTMACFFGHTGIVKRLAFYGATLSGRETADMQVIIDQAREARRNVGDSSLSQRDVHMFVPRCTPLSDLEKAIRTYADPFVGVQDPELRELMQKQILKNRKERCAQASVATQEGAAAEQEERVRAESDFKSVGFYMSNLLRRHKLSQAQIIALNDFLTYGSNDKAELKPEAANAIIINYLEQLADSVAQQGEAERKDNEDI